LKRALEVTSAISSFPPSEFGSGESVAVVGATIPVVATLSSTVLITRFDLTPTPTLNNSRIRANNAIPPLTLLIIPPLIPAAPIRRWACSLMEVGVFMSSPFLSFSGAEGSPPQRTHCDYEEKPKDGDIPPS
jgi:hypothetical protein